MKNNDFDFSNLPLEVRDPSIKKEDFVFVQENKKIHEQKFQTKPTTFLKDCVKRFAKNKSSVVATYILGFLTALAIVVPAIGNASPTHNTKELSGTKYQYLEPKLFNAGFGFWDGTKKMENIPVDTTDPDRSKWLPGSYKDTPSAISNLHIEDEAYTTMATSFGHGGYIVLAHTAKLDEEAPDVIYSHVTSYKDEALLPSFDFSIKLEVTNFDVYDLAKLEASEETIKVLPEGYQQGTCALKLYFEKNNKSHTIDLTDFNSSFSIVNEADAINVSEKFNEYYQENAFSNGWSDKEVNNLQFQIVLKNENTIENKVNSCVLIKSIGLRANSLDSSINNYISSLSFTSGTEAMIRTSNDKNYWRNTGANRVTSADIYLSKATLCSFVYDTYEAKFGRKSVELSTTEFDKYKKYVNFSYRPIQLEDGNFTVEKDSFVCEIKPEYADECPLAEPFKYTDIEFFEKSPVIRVIHATVNKYKTEEYGNLKKMPIFLFGTDKSGKDMFVYVFEGLRNSLLVGVAATAVCFLFGLLWGSISGYFGGNVDLAMERFTDILAGIPWIVLMTLILLKFGQNIITFAAALCLTGWIGTAATTRTQFYRFRGREYVLASRTLGASHGRLIAKHILPNAMGTIITSAVLMVPSVIFSEATINFIFHDMDAKRASLGVILSNNQVEIQNHPFLLVFPSVIIALVMISFNLFGNGLRDAVNPSLKGEGE